MIFDNNPPAFATTVVASVIFASSGVLNVVLYAITRPRLLRGQDSANLMRSNTSAQDWQKTSVRDSRGHFHYESQAESCSPRNQFDVPGMVQVLEITRLGRAPDTYHHRALRDV
jgi:hypothetical protein